MTRGEKGSWNENRVVDAEHIAKIPDRLPPDRAGAMAWDALTALSGLDTLDLMPLRDIAPTQAPKEKVTS